MARKNSYITVSDQFCGAGGSSQGARKALAEVGIGPEGIKLAMNHWKLAIETHNTNFPDTLHDCTDISACDPRRYPSTDILITSPECTNHSLAKGQKIVKKQMDLFESGKLDAAAERSRATMWDVVRFAEYHQYNAIIVENVVDARKWIMFDAWLTAMMTLGYNHKCVYLNSQHAHPTPQSRDRMYVVFWKKGNRVPDLEYMPLAYSPRIGKNVTAVQTWKNPLKRFGKYRQQYVYCCPVTGDVVEPYYYASFNCIDWTDIGTRIGDRDKPLSENTVTRIKYGLEKYGSQPMQVINYTPGYTKPLTDPTGVMTCNDHHGLLTPYIVQTVNGEEHQHRSKSLLDAGFTHTTLQSQAIVTPFIIKGEHTKNAGMVRPVSEPAQVQATRQTWSLVNPFVTISRGKSKTKNVNEPLTTQSQMINHGIVTPEAFSSFISSYYNGSHCTKHITETTGSVTTNDRLSIVNYSQPRVEDCFYRMLKPHEIKLAMAFEKEYVVLGTGKDQVKQLGNAVTPPAMEWLVGQVIKSLQ